MNNSPKIRLLLGLFLALLLAGCLSLAQDVTPPPGYTPPPVQQATPTTSGPMYPLVPPDPIRGEAIYAEDCVPCHGQTGMGDGPQADDLPNPVAPIGSSELARQSTPAEWYRVVSQGNLERFMPPFTSLSDHQRWDVVAYLYKLSAPPESVAQGEALYAQYCASCHGEEGQGDGSEAGDLSQPLPDFSDQASMAGTSAAEMYTAISEGGEEMPAFDQLSTEERWAMTAYLRSLTFEPSSQVAVMTPETTEVDQGGAESPVPTEVNLTETPVETAELDRTGEVEVQVINGSGGELPTDLSVVLHGYDGMSEVYSQTLDLDMGDSLSFANVPMPQNRVFLATTEYDGAIYGSDIALVEAQTTRIGLGLTVFETTTDTSALSVDRLHIFFEFLEEDIIQVVELYVISNSGERTVVSAEEDDPVVTFTLPEEASNLRFQEGAMGSRYVETEDGFGDTVSIRPGSGEYQVMFAFEMPYERSKLAFEQSMDLPTSALIVMAPEQGVKVRSEKLQDAGTREVEGISFSMFEGSGLSPGEELSVSISGRPKSGSSLLIDGGGDNTNLVIGLAGLGIALILVGAILYRRNVLVDRQEEVEEQEISTGTGDQEDPDELMDAIIALDDHYQAGELPEEAYRRRRAELKARLQELVD